MEVILLERVTNLGRVGDKVSVKPGYGRNYLVPQGKAIFATAENIQAFELKRAEYEKAQQDKLEEAQKRAEELAALEISLVLEADPAGKLYGSVNTKTLADAITQAGCAVRKEEIRLPEGSIRQIGEHVVNVHLHSEVITPVTIKIEAVAAEA